MQQTIESLEERLSRVETSNKILSIALGVCFFVFLSAAATSPNRLQARTFELVSDDGAVLAEVATRDGNPGLYLKDENGTDRLAVFSEPEQTGVFVNDTDGVTRIGIAQFSHGGGGVALHGAESKGAAVLYFKNEGSLRFFDVEGNVTNVIRATAAAGND